MFSCFNNMFAHLRKLETSKSLYEKGGEIKTSFLAYTFSKRIMATHNSAPFMERPERP